MSNLLLINYAMDEGDPVFPHQIRIARELSNYFPNVLVITNSFKSPLPDLPKNVFVKSIEWNTKSTFLNIKTFFKYFLYFKREFGFNVIFSHMTEVQSALIAPLARVLGIFHVLWYAHKSKSKYLVWNNFWINRILTSTRASCPIKSDKVKAIGQGIDERMFQFNLIRDYSIKSKWIHVGRIDPSKRIDLIISLFQSNIHLQESSELLLVGGPTKIGFNYANELMDENAYEKSSRIKFMGTKHQSAINSLLRSSSLFIHAFQGSLDKSLIEATLTGITVITCNREYLSEFGSLSLDVSKLSDEEILESEIRSFLESDPEQLGNIARARAAIALAKHSQSQWLVSVIRALVDRP